MSVRYWKRMAYEALDPTFLVAKFFCFLHVTNAHLCTIALTVGPSMLPTIDLYGDLVLADRISTRFGTVRAGDVVLLRSPEFPRKILTKRLVGMEGDRITYVIDPTRSSECGTVTVPKGHVWVQGDNIYDSRDSRDFGAIPYGLLQARVLWRIWPPKRFGPLGEHNTE